MKRAKRTIVVLSLALASCQGTIAPPAATPQVFSLQLLTTPEMVALVQELAAEFTPDSGAISLRGVTTRWDNAIQQVQAGQASYALTSFVPASAALWAAPVGYDGLAIIVHAGNPVAALTIEQIRQIFQGRITWWAEVGGPPLPITVVAQEPNAEFSQVFQAQIMNGQRITPSARLALSSARTIDLVAQTPGAIGYVSLAALDGRVRAVPLDQGSTPIAPTRATVSSGAYPLRTSIVVVGLTAPDEHSIYREWFAWMQSAAGQAIVGRRYGTLLP